MPTIDDERALAKLTRTLRVTGRREDGYHLIESEMVCLDFGDALSIEAVDDGCGSELEVVDEVPWVGGPAAPDHLAGPAVPAGPTNLVLRALEVVGRSARVRLVKRIAPGAGLGGGSADAAAILRWAGVTDPVIAASLGGDVPFCVRGGRALVTGIGEHLVPLAVDEAAYLLITPAFGVSTPAVYRCFDEIGPATDPDGVNDLERAALVVEPRLRRIRDLLAEVSGRRPSLAGSGSTWFVACRGGEGERLATDLEEAVRAEGGRASINLGQTAGAFFRG